MEKTSESNQSCYQKHKKIIEEAFEIFESETPGGISMKFINKKRSKIFKIYGYIHRK